MPVLHSGANLQADNSDAHRNATTTFINTYRIPLTIQDTSRRLPGRFGSTAGQPTFAIINGVTNSPSHRPWELLYARLLDVRAGPPEAPSPQVNLGDPRRGVLHRNPQRGRDEDLPGPGARPPQAAAGHPAGNRRGDLAPP
ncbi:MAG: hypothetical protein ACKO3N_11560, partial [Verrucomicrobiota bacterium]